MVENNFMSVEEYDNNVFRNREDIKNVLPGKIISLYLKRCYLYWKMDGD